MALAPGTKLGPYEIQSALGAGGVGARCNERRTAPGILRSVTYRKPRQNPKDLAGLVITEGRLPERWCTSAMFYRRGVLARCAEKVGTVALCSDGRDSRVAIQFV